MQKVITSVLTGGLVLVIIGGAALYRSNSNKQLSCVAQSFQDIANGITITDVERALGQPSSVVVKSSPDEYRFGQGDREALIHDGLIYNLPDSEHIEIYLDANQIVVGKNCGHA